MKISACLIAKAGLPYVAAAIKSIEPHVDEVVCIDPSDYPDCVDAQGRIVDFSLARQHSFDLAKNKCVIWLDSDDLVAGGENIRLAIQDYEKRPIENPSLTYFPYEYSYDAQGKCNCRHYRERICSDKTKFHWMGCVHEVLIPNDGVVPAIEFREDVVWKHQRQYLNIQAEPGRNLRIFERHIAKHGLSDPRTRFYYANELFSNGKLKEAAEHFEKYIEISGWDDERVMAGLNLVKMHFMLGDYPNSLKWAMKCIEIRENWGEGYFSAAKACYFLAQSAPEKDRRRFWEKCINFSHIGLSLPPTRSALFIDPNERFQIHEFLNVALSNMGDVQGALESVLEAEQAGMATPNQLHNKKLYEAALAGKPRKVSIRMSHPLEMWKLLLGHDEVLKAEKYLECLPYLFDNDQEVIKARAKMREIVAHTKSKEAFAKYYEGYCDESVPMETEITEKNYLDRYHRLRAAYDTVEEWKRVHGRSPRILDLGCQDGWVANRLAQRGYQVTGFDCTPKAKEIFEHNAKRLKLDSRVFLGLIEELDKHFEPNEFDVILCLELIEHVVEDQRLVDSIHRLLPEDGIVLFSTPCGAWWPFYDQPPYAWDKPRPHIRAYTESSLAQLMGKFANVRTEVKLVGKDHPDQKTLLLWAGREKAVPGNRLDIVVWTGPAVEPWNPVSVEEKGMGGSETACIAMCREFAKQGHKVRVYGDCENKEGTFDGVEYRYFQKINEVQSCDILISSRQPQIADAPIKAKAKFLWIHDVHVGTPSPDLHRWLLRFDRILCLSNWHKEFVLQTYPFVHPDKIIVTRNGIDLSRFKRKHTLALRENKMVFSSSADRGLEPLLDMMPEIRRRVPNAELHIYYGFDWWKKFSEMGNDTAALERIAKLEEKIACTTGTYFHGRVNQHELADAFLHSKVWAYPTWFTETSCISAMEAMAAGCVPVTTRLAALGETVKSGLLLDPPNTDQGYKERFVEYVVRMFTNPVEWEVQAQKGIEAAQGLGWDALAKDWEQMFLRTIKEVSENPVPRYAGEYL